MRRGRGSQPTVWRPWRSLRASGGVTPAMSTSGWSAPRTGGAMTRIRSADLTVEKRWLSLSNAALPCGGIVAITIK